MEEDWDWDPLARRVPSFGRGLRILLVDRDTTSLLYISSMMESHSFKVTTMEIASLAMAIFAQRKDEFDLVMADVNMQDMTNHSFIQQVLLMKNHMPIVLMSSRYAGNVVAEQALRDGACFFLQKPVSSNDLRDLWQHVYRKRWSSEKESDEGSVDSESESPSMKMNEESASDAVRNDQFRVVGSVSKANSWTASENDEPWMADLLRKNELMKQDSGLVEGDAQTTEAESLRNDRRRSSEDNTEQRKCVRKINSEQIPSQGNRPIEEEGAEKKEKGSTLEKRLYMKWTPDLHFKFTEAIRKLGDKRASPKAILEMMNIPDLKQGHISSHLQKYKAQLRSMFKVSGNTSLPLPSSVNISTSGLGKGVLQTGVPKFQEQQGSVGVNDNSLLQFHPPLSLKSSLVPGYAGPSNSIENKLHPNPTKSNNGVQIAGNGKHQWPSQTREWSGPFPSDVNMNEKGKGKQLLGFQGKNDSYVALDQAAQHCWQSLTEFSTPIKRLNQPQNMVAGLTSSVSKQPNSDIPAGICSTGDAAIPQLAHLGSSGNQSIAYCPSTGQDGLDESSIDLLTEWLTRYLDEP